MLSQHPIHCCWALICVPWTMKVFSKRLHCKGILIRKRRLMTIVNIRLFSQLCHLPIPASCAHVMCWASSKRVGCCAYCLHVHFELLSKFDLKYWRRANSMRHVIIDFTIKPGCTNSAADSTCKLWRTQTYNAGKLYLLSITIYIQP